jgi:dTDP-4-amino-4,6-dideoxygalactose transaminase
LDDGGAAARQQHTGVAYSSNWREHSQIDPLFPFINLGYNLRPMEIQAAFGLEQLKRLDNMNQHRANTRPPSAARAFAWGSEQCFQEA